MPKLKFFRGLTHGNTRRVSKEQMSNVQKCHVLTTAVKEARGSFFGHGVEVLKLQSHIEDQLRSPLYYIMIST